MRVGRGWVGRQAGKQARRLVVCVVVLPSEVYRLTIFCTRVYSFILSKMLNADKKKNTKISIFLPWSSLLYSCSELYIELIFTTSLQTVEVMAATASIYTAAVAFALLSR